MIDRKIIIPSSSLNNKNYPKSTVGFYKFLFGLKIGYENFLFFLGILFLVLHSLLTVLTELLSGICLNFFKSGIMADLETFCLFLILIGPISCFLSILSGLFFKKHSDILCEKYKKNYYSLVFKQDFYWFNSQDLNKLSESIKSDNDKIEKGVK